MSYNEAPQLVPEGNLDFYREQLAKLEHDIGAIALEIEFSNTLVEIQAHPAWRKVTDRLRSAEVNMVSRLRSQELSAYSLGKTQGMVQGLGMLLRDEPLTDGELDSRRERNTVLRAQIDELRHLLN